MELTQKGRNKADLQEMNRSLVIRTIQRQRCITRVEIAKLTGLNQATVTNIVGDLIEWGAVEEVGLSAVKTGRRSIMLELAVENYMIIGVWLTRRHFTVGIFDIYGECRQCDRFSIGINSPVDQLLDQMVCQIKAKEALSKNRTVLGIALALPGPYIKQEGQIALLTARREWQNVNIAQRLREDTGLRVVTEHDVKAAAIAESFFAPACDQADSLMCIMLGQGVGAGIIENGRLVNGALGIAGEIGHMSIRYDGPACECGNRGCLEGYCSTLSIQKRIRESLKDYPGTLCRENGGMPEIIQAYLEGDELAGQVIDDGARYLGYGIANIVNLFNPRKIIIGDELSRAGERFLEVVKESVRERIQPKIYDSMEIVLSNQPDAVLSGVCLLLVEEMVQDPKSFIRE